MRLVLSGSIHSSNAAYFVRDIGRELKKAKFSSLVVDLEKLDQLDDFGVSALAGIKKKVLGRKGSFHLENIPPQILETLETHNFDKLTAPFVEETLPPDIFAKLGSSTLSFSRDMGFALSFVGETFLTLFRVLLSPKSLRLGDTINNMRRVGVDALPIVSLISFLLGLIMAFMSSVQLKLFGANIYVASLVGLSMTREFGPIMTAIIVAGRSSSAFAAEIGSMKISHEIDALYTMGIDPHTFLVLPRVIACFFMVPLLTLFSDIFSIAGGLVVGSTMLGLTVDGYINQTIHTLTMFDVFWGVFKSGIFALFIAWIGCLRGFQVKEGAVEVGRATTSAVVSSIFMIIFIDSLFVLVLRFWQ